MKIFTVQDATKGVVVIHVSKQDAIDTVKYLRSYHPRQQYRVCEFTLEYGQSQAFYNNNCVYDSRSEK